MVRLWGKVFFGTTSVDGNMGPANVRNFLLRAAKELTSTPPCQWRCLCKVATRAAPDVDGLQLLGYAGYATCTVVALNKGRRFRTGAQSVSISSEPVIRVSVITCVPASIVYSPHKYPLEAPTALAPNSPYVCVCVHVYIYIYTYIYIGIAHTHIYIYIHIYIYTCVYIYIYFFLFSF